MLADLGDMAPRQLNMRAPKKISRDAPSEGQFVWHQSRTAGVLYFTHLLSWALSRSALSATTDASTTQQAPCENNTASGICGLPPRTLITGARVTDQPRFSILWRNFSRRASCRLIRCPMFSGTPGGHAPGIQSSSTRRTFYPRRAYPKRLAA